MHVHVLCCVGGWIGLPCMCMCVCCAVWEVALLQRRGSSSQGWQPTAAVAAGDHGCVAGEMAVGLPLVTTGKQGQLCALHVGCSHTVQVLASWGLRPPLRSSNSIEYAAPVHTVGCPLPIGVATPAEHRCC
jgi:hypothetical protein